MKLLRFVQVGDIHYPDTSSTALLDYKDGSFPEAIASQAAPIPLQSVFRDVIRQIQDGVNGILLHGDLTSKGDLSSYINCVDLIKRIIFLENNENLNGAIKLHVVPGNHDVNRSLSVNSEGNFFKKFLPLKECWDNISPDIFCIDKPLITDFPVGNSFKLSLISLNSCIGCGEKRFLPSQIADKLVSIFNNYSREVGKDNAWELLSEDLDTPAFSNDDIDRICNYLNDNNIDIAIVSSHHNILPQALTRISLYSEVINAGLVRSRLSRISMPVIYCHGHIHDKPIELVKSSRRDCAPLICVAAPKADEGYNLINIFIGNNNRALGVFIVNYKIQRDGMVEMDKEYRIPFYSPMHFNFYGDKRIVNLLSSLNSEYKRVPEIIKSLRLKGINWQPNTIFNLISEAEWFGIVDVIDGDQEFQFWQIRKIL